MSITSAVGYCGFDLLSDLLQGMQYSSRDLALQILGIKLSSLKYLKFIPIHHRYGLDVLIITNIFYAVVKTFVFWSLCLPIVQYLGV